MKTKALLAAASLVLAGCALPGQIKENVAEEARPLSKGPELAPQKNYTNMQQSLRCMDRLFLENGVRDLVVLTEDIVDNTRKLPVGARDMLTSAVSSMTRRSRAIRLITFGGDVINLVNWLNASGANSRVYTFKPDYDIRGSISQLDDNLIQQRAGVGATLGPISADKSKDASAAVLGLDTSIISTQTMELLPGVTSRNSIVVLREGEGTAAGLYGRISKQGLGINYDFSFNRNEGMAQAVRTLIELAAIELFGKLTRVPYWTCLGVDENHPLVQDEVGDWFYSLESEQKLIPYIQNQLRIRGVYRGPIDGSMNKEFVAIVPHARKALGLPATDVIDEPFFAGLINLRSKTLGVPKEAVAHLTMAQLGKKKKTKTRSISPDGQASIVEVEEFEKPKPLQITSKPAAVGEDIQLAFTVPEAGYAYCFYQEAQDRWMRVLPNRYAPDPFLAAGKIASLPGGQKVQIKAGPKNQNESIACFNTATDVSIKLAPDVLGGDFEPNPGLTLTRLRQEFAAVTTNNYSETVHGIRKR